MLLPSSVTAPGPLKSAAEPAPLVVPERVGLPANVETVPESVPLVEIARMVLFFVSAT